ncbi:hypothetical protein ASG88_17410 [Nocardioides sp. Soil777]|uniref:glycosyltransferase family 61 protein n=1 Tax=Nocardioides sp. Soil777 TaxID=1736409 RepID=UPI0007025D77|nr:glycosyltransferase 61 family protein [Nocardioides sp. Soil777]KRE98815.1 hypothetical protein ASG88_17410 [Nocardioides sp. Soil777]
MTPLLARWEERRTRRRLDRFVRDAVRPCVVLRGGDTVPAGRPPATLVDDTAPPPARAMRRAARLIWHVTPGGQYVVVAADEPAAIRIEAQWRALEAGERPTVRIRPRLRRELRRTIGGVRRDGRLVVVDKVGASLLKVGETSAPTVTRRADVALQVLARHEESVFTPARTVTSRGTGGGEALTSWRVPPSEVRRWTGDVTLHEGMVVAAGATLLPETFKWFEHEPLANERLRDITPRFARLRNEPTAPVRRLEGSHYFFEYKNSGHYGHLMTEGLAKLWGWEEARRHDPDVRLVVRRHRRDRGRPTVRPDVAVLAAYGISLDDVVWLEEPVVVDTLFTATPQLHNKEPYSIDPRITEVWDRVLHGLLRNAPEPSGRERIFVTRRAGHRLCHNWAEVEAEFTDAGFGVVDPSRHALPEQARLFHDARAVGGFGGTGMFNLVFADQAPPVVVLNHAAYDARNEELITAARGSDLHYLWSAPDRDHPAGGFDYRAFQSPWRFDVEQHGQALRALLRDL